MKLKKNKGSALTLAIIVTALMSITVMIISSQVNNQIKFNSRQYEDMKYKYMAEAGIEKAIYKIKEEIKSKVIYNSSSNIVEAKERSISHDNCPKVEFKDGKPIIGHWAYNNNDFSNLIYMDIIHNKSNVIYNEVLYSSLVPILGSDHILIADAKLRTYYETEIKGLIENINNHGDLYYDHNKFENTINTFIGMIDTVIIDIEKIQGTYDTVINNLNYMRYLMIEIKCRLGMLAEEDGSDTGLELISINVPQYTVSLDNGDLKFVEDNILATIEVDRDNNGQLKSIDLSDLNNKTNSEINMLSSSSGNKSIESRVEFVFTKLTNDYDIVYKINSYEQK